MSAPELRPFQQRLVGDIENEWARGATNVMPVAATGSGKTVVLSHLIAEETGRTVAIAHRQELVSQISMALARNGVQHSLMSTAKGSASPLLRMITALHTFEFGRPYLSQNARAAVVGVDTLVRHKGDPSFQHVKLVVQDEAHHVLKDNKWGIAASLFPNARGLYPTATPLRADGKGLGRHAHGIIDALVHAPSMREIINMGFLTDYRIFCPPNSKLHRIDLHISDATGDFVREEMVKAVREAQIVGDVVASYLAFAAGKRGVTFCVDVEEAERQAAAFNAAGIPAAALSAKSPDNERHRTLQKLRAGELLQVTNVDLFGEGFDLPAIEVVSFARPTQSFALYVQQFGRVLRLMLTAEELRGFNQMSDAQRRMVIAASGKPVGLIIDHVGNVEEHLVPDREREWSLDARQARGTRKVDDAIPLRTCTSYRLETGEALRGCYQPYERIHKECPYCGLPVQPPAQRSGPEHVDGDLVELSPEILARMRGEIARVDGACHVPRDAPPYVQAAIRKKHKERQEAQRDLRNAIAWWAGYSAARGDSESEGYRRFYLTYGVDVATAQTLGRPEAEELAQRINQDLARKGIDASRDALAWGQQQEVA